ncbi:hypothetical protein HQ590_09335 [bacterium]|nr:hypothetical protein [bacterium]
MTGRERVEIALRGGKPDRVPVVPIYDCGYVMRSTGRDLREWRTHTGAERIAAIEASFLRHDVDGVFVHYGTTDDWAAAHSIEKHADSWLITDRTTGEQHRLLPDGGTATVAGTPNPVTLSHEGVSLVETVADLDRLCPAGAATASTLEAAGRFEPLRHLAGKYPDRHFSFQTGSPMVFALNLCGGYAEGLTTFAGDRPLFRKILARMAERECAHLQPGKRAGGRSTWFTSYHTGADTISPRDYREIVFPYDREVCQAAKDAGLFVLHWYLGNLMPVLDTVLELPMDALVLEQGRKWYTIDPVEIRKRVGPKFCLFGFGYEYDYCTFNRAGLTNEFGRQFAGAGADGAFVAGTPIMPPNANPEAVDFYFREARRIGTYISNVSKS